MDTDWLAEGLEEPLSDVLKVCCQLATHSHPNRFGRHDATGPGCPLKSGGDVHPIAVHSAVGLLHHIAEVKAQAKAQTTILRNPFCFGLEVSLDGKCSRRSA